VAGSSSFSPQFPEALFRNAIQNTMRMGMPEDESKRLTWWWNREKDYVRPDPTGKPYGWSEAPTTNVAGGPNGEDHLVVDYAIEFSARPAGSVVTALGEMDTSRAVVTLMDADWQQVKTADYARIGDARYKIQFEAPPMGLFEVTVHQVYLEAVDES
jgi:hypothetical protein